MKYNLIEYHVFKDAKLYLVENQPHIAIIQASTNYISMDYFKQIFEQIGLLVKKNNITKLIFDKTNLSIFHQPSMEWYFIEWKEEMFGFGLKTHRKILPDNELFRMSVKIGRAKIAALHPDGKFNLMDIANADSVEQAIEN